MAYYDYTYGLGLGPPLQQSNLYVTQWVGPRKQFHTDTGALSSKYHPGVDLRAKVGTNLLAPMDGQVIHVVNMNDGTRKKNSKKGYGNQIVIRRDDGLITVQSHLDSANVKVGDRVHKGQVIGLSGYSGNVTGPHLDYIVVKDGKALRPDGTPYISYDKAFLHGKGIPTTQPTTTAPTSNVPDIGLMPATNYTPTALPTMPQVQTAPIATKPQPDFLETLEQQNAGIQSQLDLLTPKYAPPRVTEQFFATQPKVDWNAYYG